MNYESVIVFIKPCMKGEYMQKLNIYCLQTFSVEVESEPLGVVIAPQHVRVAKVELRIVARDGKGGRSTVR